MCDIMWWGIIGGSCWVLKRCIGAGGCWGSWLLGTRSRTIWGRLARSSDIWSSMRVNILSIRFSIIESRVFCCVVVFWGLTGVDCWWVWGVVGCEAVEPYPWLQVRPGYIRVFVPLDRFSSEAAPPFPLRNAWCRFFFFVSSAVFPGGVIAHCTFHMEEGTILFDTELVLYRISAQTRVPVPALLASVTALSVVGSEVA